MFMLISFYDIILFFLIITFILIFFTSEKFEIIFKKMVDIIIFLWYNTFVAMRKAVSWNGNCGRKFREGRSLKQSISSSRAMFFQA